MPEPVKLFSGHLARIAADVVAVADLKPGGSADFVQGIRRRCAIGKISHFGLHSRLTWLGPVGTLTFSPACYSVIMVFMAKQETLLSKKRRGPKPTGVGTLIGVRLQPESLEAVDAWRKKQDDLPSRPEAIRRLVEVALSAKA